MQVPLHFQRSLKGVATSDDFASSRPKPVGGAAPERPLSGARLSPGSQRKLARKTEGVPGSPLGDDRKRPITSSSERSPGTLPSRTTRISEPTAGSSAPKARTARPGSDRGRSVAPFEARAPRPVRQLNRRIDTAAPLTRSPRKSERPRTAGPKVAEKAPWQAEKWLDEGPVRAIAGDAVQRSTGQTEERSERSRVKPLPAEVVVELQMAVGAKRAVKLEERLDAARGAFERERYSDAKRIIAKLAEEAPGAAAVRELYGLTLYRLERWRQAAGELEAYRLLTDSVDQHPVLADCYRALKRYSAVEELWDELRRVSPSADVTAEGRIVMAGSLADRGMFAEAIDLLERAPGVPKKVRDHHLRTWYALADLYDRAGDVPRARQLFRRVNEISPGFADVEYRLSGLGR